MSTDLHVIAVIEGKPGSAETIKAVATPCIEATRKEPGCLKYNLHQDQARPDHFIFVEHWASSEILDQHNKAPHLKALVDGLADLTIKPLEVSVLKELF
ncbi:putative quinol monooxygenase [Acerihabitans sp. TG2]|uniref:putative quinol monooxygenase n=1 Tax=Acerihabitans sp. TG2 TaxID=3096008 RepID=UPI002B230E6C|nr:putative quinol monooxygenase [Acerihabitans sp. TG2]MEA9390497.1 putative quinol monooxygenase [Acerihabitans sp. TG2]